MMHLDVDLENQDTEMHLDVDLEKQDTVTQLDVDLEKQETAMHQDQHRLRDWVFNTGNYQLMQTV